MAVASACPQSSFLSWANCSCSEEPLQRKEETAVAGGPGGHCASTWEIYRHRSKTLDPNLGHGGGSWPAEWEST